MPEDLQVDPTKSDHFCENSLTQRDSDRHVCKVRGLQLLAVAYLEDHRTTPLPRWTTQDQDRFRSINLV